MIIESGDGFQVLQRSTCDLGSPLQCSEACKGRWTRAAMLAMARNNNVQHCHLFPGATCSEGIRTLHSAFPASMR